MSQPFGFGAVVILSLVAAFNRPAPAADSFFPIMSWELPPRTKEFSDASHGLKSLADCGFTVAGFLRPNQLPECEKVGLKAIVCPAEGILKWQQMTDQDIERRIEQLVNESHNSSATVGYFITDEPGVGQFPSIARAVAAVKKFAPNKLAYINLFPDYATLGAPDLSQLGTSSYTEYLQRFVTEVKPELISYDNYQVQYSHDLKEPKPAASYFNNLLSIRSIALQHNLPFWNIVSSNQIRPKTPPPSPANLLLQAYTTLAAGAKGLTWYTYYSGGYEYAPVDKQGHRTASWSYLKTVNDQVKVLGPILTNLTSTGVYFTTPSPAEGLPQLPGKLINKVESALPAMIGEFSGEHAQQYAMLVNLSLRESAKFTLTCTSAVKLKFISPVDASTNPVDDNSLWIAPGQGVLLRVK